MCIIILKPAGAKFPPEKILKNCFDNNPDGAGFMFPDKSQVHIHKGFMKYSSLLKALADASKRFDLVNTDVVMHFRLATHGAVKPGNCHPFPLSKKVDDMRTINLVSSVGIVHNGVINFCGSKSKGKSALSDTQLFILDYLARIPERELFNPAIQRLIHEATDSKFVIMSSYETNLIGNYLKDEGIYYSNGSYQRNYWRYSNNYDFCTYCGNFEQGTEIYGEWLCLDCMIEFGIIDDGRLDRTKRSKKPGKEVN